MTDDGTPAAGTPAAQDPSSGDDADADEHDVGPLVRSVADAGLNAFGCVFVELWVIAEDGTKLFRPHGGHWMNPAFSQSLPDESLIETALGLDREARDCPPGAGLAGCLSEESQNKGGVHWRQIGSLLNDPFVQRGSGNRMEQFVELGIGLVGAVSFNLSEARGIVLYYSRSTVKVDRLRAPGNEQYMICAADLIGANYAIRKSLAASSEQRRALFLAAMKKVKKQLLKDKFSIGEMAMCGETMDKLRLERAQESVQDIKNPGRGARAAERVRHLGGHLARRVANSRKKWRGAGLHGPPQQSFHDCCFVLVGVFFTMLTMLKIAGALGEADSRFGFSASWYSSTLCIVYALTPAPVGQPRQILAAHLWNMLVGMACREIPGGAASWGAGPPLIWKQALAVALGVSGQGYIGILHPPATGLSLAFASDPRWTWTTLVAVCLADGVVVLISVLYLNMSETKQFPLYWLGLDFSPRALANGTPIDRARSNLTKSVRRVQEGVTAATGSVKRRRKVGGENAV